MAPANYLILLIRDPPKADIAEHGGNVRFVPERDMLEPPARASSSANSANDGSTICSK
jgi:hypothetical protein